MTVKVNLGLECILDKTPVRGIDDFEGLDTVMLDLELNQNLPDRKHLVEVNSRSVQRLHRRYRER